MPIDLSGLYPPIPTPFDDDGQVAYHHLRANLTRWLSQPLDGVVMPGSNSEAVYLTTEERIRIWQVCAEALKGSGKRLIAGTGAESTRETIGLTIKAAELGAQAFNDHETNVVTGASVALAGVTQADYGRRLRKIRFTEHATGLAAPGRQVKLAFGRLYAKP